MARRKSLQGTVVGNTDVATIGDIGTKTKGSALTAMGELVVADDVLPTVNVSNPSQGAGGTLSGAKASQLAFYASNFRSNGIPPSGAFTQTLDRTSVTIVNLATSLVSGTVNMTAVYLLKGTVVTSITVMAGTTGITTGTHQLFGLYDASRNRLAQTSDDTSTAWTASTSKTLTLTAPFTITADGVYYIGIMITATTVPTFAGVAAGTIGFTVAPIINGRSSTAQTSLPNPAATITANTNVPWIWLS